jgi:hypothetical protein
MDSLTEKIASLTTTVKTLKTPDILSCFERLPAELKNHIYSYVLIKPPLLVPEDPAHRKEEHDAGALALL